MSLETWKAEFYRKDAHETTPDEAVAHSVAKWRGLTKGNLAAHNVQHSSFGSIEDEHERMSIDTRTCALCVHFRKEDEDEDGFSESASCDGCQLYAVRGDVSCDDNREGEKLSPYQVWVDHGDPAPMILWLEKAAKAEGKS